LSFAVDGQFRNFPEELYFAWMEPTGVTALQSGDHQIQGGNVCHDRKAMDWIRSGTNRAAGISEADLPDGVTTMRAHLRDTDHDGRWTDRDSTDALWVSGGRVCRSSVPGIVAWCRTVDGASRSEELVVRDILGTGAPQILVGSSVLDTSGEVLWTLGQRSSALPLDADEDGQTDHYTVNGTCQQLTLANGTVAWSTGCAGSYRTFAWKDLARDPVGCSDLSLSALKAGADGLLTVRVANAGTVDLGAGAVLDVLDPAGAKVASYLLPAVSAGHWMDLQLNVKAQAGQSVRVERSSLDAHGFFDADMSNNTRSLMLGTSEE
jgi:hypothetical protein